MSGVERVIDAWEGQTGLALAARWDLPAAHLFEAVGSTNDVARELAASGAECGTLVLADRQLAGRGRAGRSWDSPARLGIWLSMVVPAPGSAEGAGLLPLRVGVAVARAVEPFVAPERVGLKWPNDLLVGEAKVGGVLCEGTWIGEVPGPVVVGVGLNVCQLPDDIPAELRGFATSLRIAAARPPSRLEVADALVTALTSDLIRSPLAPDRLARELEARDTLAGRKVTVYDPTTREPRLSGVAAGIGAEGSLLVRLERPDAGGAGRHDREIRAIRAGTVRLTERETSVQRAEPRR